MIGATVKMVRRGGSYPTPESILIGLVCRGSINWFNKTNKNVSHSNNYMAEFRLLNLQLKNGSVAKNVAINPYPGLRVPRRAM